MDQFERHTPPAAKATIDFAGYGTAEAVPLQSGFELSHCARNGIGQESPAERIYGQATSNLLADMEHELRLSRHTVWLGIADGEHERDL
jgi:hypothetical protein